MVLHPDIEIENQFKSIVYNNGNYKHGDLSKQATVALREYIDKYGDSNE